MRTAVHAPAAGALVAALLGAASCTESSGVADAVRAELAPTGTLRAAINLGNPVLVTTDGPRADLAGIAPDIAREIGRRLEVPVQFVPYPSAPAAADAAASGRWDVAFIGADPAREAEIAFTKPYVELEATYLVPAGSSISSVAEADREGVRIAARPRTAYDLLLQRTLKSATLVYPADTETDLNLIETGRADALAGLRHALEETAEDLPGSRVLDGRAVAIQQAIGVPRARAQGLAWLETFLDEIRESGWLTLTIEARGARGVTIPAG